jgi:Pvc16 N-terminal domain/Carboxypeptidase regulatory-like domain
MFQDLDSTLTALLNDATMPPSLAALRNADKSFVTPDKNFTAAQPTVNLFLYEVRENRNLRTNDPVIQRVGNTFTQVPPPLRVDCCYLVTTWSAQSGAVGVAEAHGLLAQALLWLSRFPIIPALSLQGSLVGQDYAPPTLVAQAEGQKNIGEFWFALGIPPRPAFHLTVTIELEVFDPVTGTIAITQHIQLGERTAPDALTLAPDTLTDSFRIGGSITDATKAPVSGANVSLVEIGLTALSDAGGQYVLGTMIAGTYTLRVNHAAVQKDTSITVPALMGSTYDVQLT